MFHSVRGLLRLGAVALALITVTGGVALWGVISFAARLGESIDVSASEDLSTVVAETRGTIEAASSSVRAASDLGRGLEHGSRETADALESVGGLIGGDVAASLSSVEEAMPALVDAGQVIDSTLSALTLFGVDYDPEVPFDQALIEVQTSLEGLPQEVRSQGRDIAALAPVLQTTAGDTDELVSSMSDMAAELDDVSATLAQIESSAGAADRVMSLIAGIERYRLAITVLLVVAVAAGLTLSAVTWRLASLELAPGDWHMS